MTFWELNLCLHGMYQLSEQEDLIVWMRTAALPTFRKLYGKIETDIEDNEEVMLVIQNNYNTYEFGARKSIVLSTTAWVGGRNHFLGLAYILIGGISLLLAVGFLLLYVMQPRWGSTAYSPLLYFIYTSVNFMGKTLTKHTMIFSS